MDWSPIIHDAVKIGLGAFIGGVFAIIGTHFASRRRIREDLISKRRDHLIEMTREFSRLHTMFTDQWSHRISAIAFEKEPDASARDLVLAIEEALLEREPEIYEGLLALHELEAQLCVIGYPLLSHLVEQYRFSATEIGSLSSDGDAEQREQALEAHQNSLMQARANILAVMTMSYQEG